MNTVLVYENPFSTFPLLPAWNIRNILLRSTNGSRSLTVAESLGNILGTMKHCQNWSNFTCIKLNLIVVEKVYL